ncbi:MAG: EpsG family protein, partial [Acetivibrio ethanolgignens]
MAFTQSTKSGDISRVYEYAIRDAENIGNIAWGFRASLFSLINAYIYRVTGQVQYISLVWIFLLYLATLLSILNILEYKKDLHEKHRNYIVTAIFCFIIFTQVTEIMKQGVAAALFFYSFTSLMNGRKWNAVLTYLFSFGIHPTAFFYLPLYATFYFKKKKILLVLVIVSFFFRHFNLMEFATVVFHNWSFFSSIYDLAEDYNEHH